MLSARFKIIIHDFVMISLAWFGAIWTRFNFEVPPAEFMAAAIMAYPVVLAVQSLAAWRFGLYRGLWRFASLPDLWNIIRAAVIGTLCIGLALFVWNRLAFIPRSALILYPVFLVALIGAPRLLYRVWKDQTWSLRASGDAERVIVIGAGTSGEALVRDMLREGPLVPVGLVDDRRDLRNYRIHGVPVLGTVSELPTLVERHEAELLLIAIPSATNEQMRRIVEICEEVGVPFRTLPRLSDVVAGNINLNAVREVSIDDLLGRAKVELDWEVIQKELTGKIGTGDRWRRFDWC